MAEKDKKMLEGRWKSVEGKANDGRKYLENTKAEVEKLQKKVAECGWSEETEKHLDVDWRSR